MYFQEIVALQHAMWLESLHQSGTRVPPLFLLGPPGVGKSAVSKACADLMTAGMQMQNPGCAPALHDDFDTTSMFPEDLSGIPAFSEVEGVRVTKFALQDRLLPFVHPKAYGVLNLDDITQASPAVQVAARRTVLYGRVGDYTVNRAVAVIATGNRRQDQSGATKLPAHFLNSVCIVNLTVSVDEWITWYRKDARLSSIIPGYISFRGLSALSQLPAAADDQGAFPTPRSWAKLGRILAASQKTDTVQAAVFGTIGSSLGVEFMAYLATRDSFDAVKILLDPQKEIPNPSSLLGAPDKIHALMNTLGEQAAAWKRTPATAPTQGKDPAVLLMDAVAYISPHAKENFMIACHAYANAGRPWSDLIGAVPRMSAKARAMLTDLAKVMDKTK